MVGVPVSVTDTLFGARVLERFVWPLDESGSRDQPLPLFYTVKHSLTADTTTRNPLPRTLAVSAGAWWEFAWSFDV